MRSRCESLDQQELQKLVEGISMQFFGKAFVHQAVFNKRLRTTGGRYLLHTHDIEINYKYYEAFGIEEIYQIVKHELCHYHLHINGLPYRHGDADFLRLLEQVGAKMYCKPLPFEIRRKGFRYMYLCKDCGQNFLRKKSVNIGRYRCGSCGGEIILKEKIGQKNGS